MKFFCAFLLVSSNSVCWRHVFVQGFSSSSRSIPSSPPTEKQIGRKRSSDASRNGDTTTSRVSLKLKKSNDMEDSAAILLDEMRDIGESIGILASSIPILKRSSDDSSTNLVQTILQLCDEVEDLDKSIATFDFTLDDLSNIDLRMLLSSLSKRIRKAAIQYKRYELLVQLLQNDYTTYITTASFLSPNRLSRWDLPNVQDVPFRANVNTKIDFTEIMASKAKDEGVRMKNASAFLSYESEGTVLVPDCSLENIEYKESLLDQLLLYIFRKLVTQNTGGITSSKSGILGLLEQGRTFMLQTNQTSETQHTMVQDTLAGLMTPVLPPFYRIFMSGIVPKLGTPVDGKQYGPWFYAPFLTSFVTPTFFGFLVGPSYPNRRQDGEYGGLLVEKCKFLQESNCKGLCLHQCKLPAQQFFADTLGLPLTVSPNFVTQECQWSFGQVPIPVVDDPSFPKGCLTGCASRQTVNERRKENKNLAFVDLCNS